MTESLHDNTAADARKPVSLADLVDVRAVPSLRESFSRSVWIKVAVIAALFVAVNWRQFIPLASKWIHDTNWTHGMVIPLVSLYLLYTRRDDLLAAPRRVCLWGLPLVLLSVFAIIVSFYPLSNYWLCQLAMVALLFSLVLYLAGWRVIRVAWVPILYLMLAMPIPDLLYSRIAVPLQEFAAKFSGLILQMVGVQMTVTASHVSVISRSGVEQGLTVAEACSGVRSLMAFLALSIAWAYLENRPVWQRVVLALSALPVAIICNVIRVAITTTMYVIDKPELGQKFMHEITGMVMLIPAFLMFWGLSRFLQSLFVEVEDEGSSPGGTQEAPGEVKL